MRTRLAQLLLLLLPLLPIPPARAGEGEVALMTDDAIPRYIERGRELARAKQWEKMCDVLQRVIVGDAEIFPDLRPEVLHAAVHSPDGELFFPARELCLAELRRLPPEGLAVYRGLYDPAARDAFEAAQREPRMEVRLVALAGVYEPFLVSSVGDDALEAAADIQLALGRHDEALALLRRLIEGYPKDSDRDLALATTKAIYCAARIGNATMRESLLLHLNGEFGESRVIVEGKSTPVSELATHPALALVRRGGVSRPGEQEWPCAGGNPAGTGIGEDLPEDLPAQPFWRYRLEERDARLAPRDGHWRAVWRDRGPSSVASEKSDRDNTLPYPCAQPILMDGVVYYKDGREIVARQASTGRRIRFADRAAADTADGPRPRAPRPVTEVRPGTGSPDENRAAWVEELYRHLDYGGHALAASQDHVVSLEWQYAPDHLVVGPDGNSAIPNFLAVYTRPDGRTLWAWEKMADFCSEAVRLDPASYETWRADWRAHQFACFLGPGVVSDGVLYTLAREQESGHGVSLWAFRVDDGRLLYRTQLHLRDALPHTLPSGSALAVSGGVVYAITGSGVVAAVDALAPGRVRWIRRYARSVRSGRIAQRLAFNAPVTSGGLVFCAPVDGKEFFALDAESGALAWSLPIGSTTGQVNHILGISGGILVLAGQDILFVDAATGKPRGRPRPLPVRPFGRGFVGSRYAYVPVQLRRERSARIHRFNLETGEPIDPIRLDVDKLGNLLSINGRLIIVNDDEILCFTTREREEARLSLRLKEEGASSSLHFEQAMLALSGTTPDRLRAAEEFRAALALAARHGTEAVSLHQYAIDNLLELARSSHEIAPLVEAQQVAASLCAFNPPSSLRLYEAQAAFVEIGVLAARGRAEEAMERTERLPEEYPTEKIVVEGEVLPVATGTRLLREKLLELPEFRAIFTSRVRESIATAVAKGDKEELRSIPRRFNHQTPTEEALFALAKIFESEGELAHAELVLKTIVENHPDHPRCPEAELEVARLFLERNLLGEARRWRDRAVAHIDEEGRRRLAPLIGSINEALAGIGKLGMLPRLALPLGTHPLDMPGHAPVTIRGNLPPDLPPGFLLTADDGGYSAWDAEGTLIWRAKNPAGQPIPPGPPTAPEAIACAAAVGASRDAFVVDGDLVLADLTGVLRVVAGSGEVRWKRPAVAEHAASTARECLSKLREDLVGIARGGARARRDYLPSHAIAGGLLIRVMPLSGIEAYDLASGSLAWQDIETTGATVGGPQVEGQLIAVGWSEPALVRVLDLEGTEVSRITGGEEGVLLSPPMLDPLGRLFVVTGRDARATAGAMRVRSARDGKREGETQIAVRSPQAAMLYADGLRAVFHDGSAGVANLHFIDFGLEGRVHAIKTEALLRNYHIARDGQRLFVFTFTQGVLEEGARLLRIDTAAREVLSYEYPTQLTAFARPVLTQRYVAILGSDSRSTHVRLYDREASGPASPPSEVFAVSGGLTARLTFEAPPGSARPHFGVPTAIAAHGEGLVASGPFGIYRLADDSKR